MSGSLPVCRSSLQLYTSKAQNVLKIGTSTGFGRFLALGALARGDRVIATARSIETIQDFPKSDNIRLLQLDLDWDWEKIEAVVKEAAAIWGRIDVLTNNAGYGQKGLIEEIGSVLP
jgi:NAD(P)-dependent dehydrogenase (short-subunit alcohol dehydrogenase family)